MTAELIGQLKVQAQVLRSSYRGFPRTAERYVPLCLATKSSWDRIFFFPNKLIFRFFLVADLLSSEFRDFPWWRFGEEALGSGSLRVRFSGMIASLLKARGLGNDSCSLDNGTGSALGAVGERFCSSYFAAFASFIVGLVGWYLIKSGLRATLIP